MSRSRLLGGRWRAITLAIGVILGGCSNAAVSSGFDPGGLVTADLPASHSPSGAYLAGRVAEQSALDREATVYYARAMAHAPNDPLIGERLLAVSIADGRLDVADKAARRLASAVKGAPLTELFLAVEALEKGDDEEARAHAAQIPRLGFYRFSGAIAQAWTIAAAGKLAPGHADSEKAALQALQGMGNDPVLAPLLLVHAAMIEDLAGDDAAAMADYRRALAPGRPPLRLVQLAGNFLERTGHQEEARTLYQDFLKQGQGSFGYAPEVSAGRPRPLIASAKDGLAEGLFDVASLMNRAGAVEATMISVRLSLYLRPSMPLATIILGDALAAQNRNAEALAAYRSIDAHAPLGWAAQLAEAQLLIGAKKWPEANALLAAMAKARPEETIPLESLGDVARFQEKFADAVQWYTRALAKLGPESDPDLQQMLYFNRGIAYERGGRWPQAESDLRRALALRPDDPQVENYLGYAMVDRGERLREGLSLVQQAVNHAPEDGYIVDSLGWAYYKLREFPKATQTLERAIELKPADPEITSHLGDAYWGSGRREEARLEWRRALELKPDPGLAQSISRKLQGTEGNAQLASPSEMQKAAALSHPHQE